MSRRGTESERAATSADEVADIDTTRRGTYVRLQCPTNFDFLSPGECEWSYPAYLRLPNTTSVSKLGRRVTIWREK